MQESLSDMGVTFTGKLTPDVINAVADLSGDLAAFIRRSFPENVVPFMFDADGGLRQPFVAYLNAEDPQQALTILWKTEILSELDRVISTEGQTGDRVVQFLASAYHLGAASPLYLTARELVEK